MPRATGSVRVLTFKEGLLSRVAHDLRLAFDVFSVAVDGERVSAAFELDSLRVEGAMRDGALDQGSLEPAQRQEIERAAREDVLGTRRHPRARFEGTAIASGGHAAVRGELELAGRRALVAFDAEETDGVYRARFPLTPSQFGIAPYKALLGAIRLRDRLEIELELRVEA